MTSMSVTEEQTLCKKREILVTSIFLFSHNFFKGYLSQGCLKLNPSVPNKPITYFRPRNIAQIITLLVCYIMHSISPKWTVQIKDQKYHTYSRERHFNG